MFKFILKKWNALYGGLVKHILEMFRAIGSWGVYIGKSFFGLKTSIDKCTKHVYKK